MATTVLMSQEKTGAAVSVDRFHLLFLSAVFVVTLPVINRLVHGSDLGYYADLRTPIILHNFDFEQYWRHSNLGFALRRVNPTDQFTPDQFTNTGHVNNLFSIRLAILLTPFFLLAHSTVLIGAQLGGNISPDRFSFRSRVHVAVRKAFYDYCGLLLSYLLARKYVNATRELLATLCAWISISLPVYMYFNSF